MFQWRRKSEGSELVQSASWQSLKNEIAELRNRIDAVDAARKADLGEVLEITERLDRITKRSFRLREQMKELEGDSKKAEVTPLTRADLLRRGSA